MKKHISPQRWGDLAACAISAWCFIAYNLAVGTPGAAASKNFAKDIPLLPVVLIAFLLAFAITALITKVIPVAHWLLLGTLTLYGSTVLYSAGNQYFYLSILAVFALACAYFINRAGDDLNKVSRFTARYAPIVITVIGLLALAYLVTLTLCRLFSYSSPCFDFGIFAQMFHNMLDSFQPLTTCERDKLLSHFAVHISPIFYLYLPFYALVPHPATLLVMQAVFLFSGIIPLLLLARKFSLSRPLTVIVSALYFTYPAMIGGCFYDLHENKLLLPLLLWLLCLLEHKRYGLVYLFAFLVFFVKEDAPIYVAFIAIYWIFAKPRKRHGIALLVLSGLYFAGAVYLLERFGEGAMFGRYNNFIDSKDSPLELVKTVLINPALVLYESLTEDKLGFLAYMLLPLGLLPLLTRRWSRLILILPMVLVNLMPDYHYQHNIGYQYTYGVAALLFYLLLLNLPELNAKTRRGLLLFAISATVLLTAMRMPGQINYLRRVTAHAEDNQRIAAALELIPDEAAVRSSTMFVPQLSQRSTLYEIGTYHPTEYAVLDLRPYIDAKVEGYDIDFFERNGWNLVVYEENVIAIFSAPS